MLNVVLIFFNIILYTLQTLLFKMYADRYPGKGKYSSFVYSAVSSIIIAIVSLAFGGFRIEFNPLTMLLGALNAFSAFVYYFMVYLSSKNGPYSIVMVFSIAGGISIPVLFSFLFLGEVPSVWKLLCFLVIFAAGYFVAKKPDEQGSIKNKKLFFAAASGLAVVNGLYGGLINLQQAYTGESQNDEMLIYTFIFSSIASLLFLFIMNKKETPRLFLQTKASLIFMLSAATAAALAINMLVIIAEFIDVNLLWTFNNSGVLILSVLASAIFFKEKLTKSNLIGCAVISIALIAVSTV